MTSEQFAYWLQGFAELNVEPPSAEQWQMIRDHLALVFGKVTPQRSPTPPSGILPLTVDVLPRCEMGQIISVTPAGARTYC